MQDDDYVTYAYVHNVYQKDIADISEKLYKMAQDRSHIWQYVMVLVGVLTLILIVPVFVMLVKKYLRERVNKSISSADLESGDKGRQGPPPTMDVRHSFGDQRPKLLPPNDSRLTDNNGLG